MIRRYTSSDDEHERLKQDAWSRSLFVNIAGWLLLVSAALLILGGAYRAQANMVTAGLLFLAMGVFFPPGIVKMDWPMKVILGVLAIVGAIYTFVT